MTPAEGIGSNNISNMPESARKEWRPPGLRKLPIAATGGEGGTKPGAGDEGNSKKVGDAGHVS